MSASVAERVSDKPVAVSEMFLSHQGEGPNFGRLALFLRLMNCNLTCGWPDMPQAEDSQPQAAMACDTRYTWDPTAADPDVPARTLTRGEIWRALEQLQPNHHDPAAPDADLLVITGGEPLLQMGLLVWLADIAHAHGMRTEIETNATITPSTALARTRALFNCGLKLASSGVRRKKRIKPAAIAALERTGRARWKFVVTDLADVEEAAGLREEFGLREVWLSPEGITAESVLGRTRQFTPLALAYGMHMTSRLHILAYGGQRGT